MSESGIDFNVELNDESWKLTAYFHSFGALPGIQVPPIGNLISTKLLFEQAMDCCLFEFEKFIARTKEVSSNFS